MASPADPSEFAVAVAVGYAHVLDKVLGFLERTSAACSSVVAVSLALPALLAYLVFVTIAFAVRVAADGYAQVVACSGGEGALAEQAAALSPEAVLGWVASVVIKLAAFFVLFCALAVALFHLGSSPCSAQ